MGYWVQVHKSPIVYRYIDWSITVPMLAFGFMGETRQVNVTMGFCAGMGGWFFILNEIFFGEAGGVSGECPKAVRESFNSMRLIVTAGWSIYPLGYVFGLMLGQADDATLNIIYNIADFVNKIAFVLACWSAAKSDSEGKQGALLDGW